MVGSVPEISEIVDLASLDLYFNNSPNYLPQIISYRCALRAFPMVVSVNSNNINNKKAIICTFRIIFYIYCFFKYEFIINDDIDFQNCEKIIKNSLNFKIENYKFNKNQIYSIDAIKSVARSISEDSDRIGMNCAESLKYSNFILKNFIEEIKKDLYIILFKNLKIFDEKLHSEIHDIEYEPYYVDFKTILLSWEFDWSLIYKFYVSIVNGLDPISVFNIDLGVENVIGGILNEPENFWARDPDVVMRDLTERLRPPLPPVPEITDEALDRVRNGLTQIAADFTFRDNDVGAIDAVPFAALANNPAFAATTLAEAKDKAIEFSARLERSNAPGRVKRSVSRLLDVLPNDLSQLNPALLRSRSRSLEADAGAYRAAGAEAELFPDAVSELLDLTGTLRDLQGCFPSIAEVERNTVAVEISGREDAVLQALSEISASVSELRAQQPQVITQQAVNAVMALDADIEDAVDPEVRRNLIAGKSLIARNFLSVVYRKALAPFGREASRVVKLHYDAVIEGSVNVARRVPSAALAYFFVGPLGVIAVILPDLFKSLSEAKALLEKPKSE